MKKILALLLALALCAALCACGKEAAPAQSGPREDISATPIPKPGSGAAPEKPANVKPAETPEPAVPIEVDNLCILAGTHATDGGYNEYFSFALPEVSGPDTDYIRALNEEVQGIYDEYVAPALDALESDGYLSNYCTCYQYAVNDGIHSLLITCDTDWGEDYYWCYNFDDAGNKVENAEVLKAAGMTEAGFVSAARDFLTDWTDLSAYFTDDSWKEYQEQTIADDNCNAAMPMVLQPDGSLCFISRVYTPAGAGVYDRAMEFTGSGEIGMSDIGTPLLTRLAFNYLVDPEDVATEDGTSYLLDFFTVGDTLTVEVTGFYEDSPLFYYAADVIPEEPEDLLRADIDSLRVRVLPYCPDVMGGTYYGEPGLYTLTIGEDWVSFTDFEGGTPLLGGGDDFTANYVYRDDLGIRDDVPDVDDDHFDYDAIQESGLPGVWSGYYVDAAYDTHSLTLEMTNWGDLILRDCVDGQIPRVLAGSYYLNQEDEDYPADTVVFTLASRAGYKQPILGCCYMFLQDDGTLLIDEEVDGWYDKMTQVDYENYYCVLRPVPAVRYLTEPQILELQEEETLEVDLDLDGAAEELSYSFTRDEDSGGTITELTFVLDGEETTLGDQWLYDAEVWFIQPAYSGQAFFYVDGVSDNDGHYLQVVGVNADGYWFAGDYYGGFAEAPEDVEALQLRARTQLLSTMGASRAYHVSPGGMPEAVEPFFYADGKLELTAKQDMDAWIVAPDTAELIDTTTLSAGTKAALLRTDAGSFWDLKLENGDVRRVWIATGDGPQTIDGVPVEDCFDGILFGG